MCLPSSLLHISDHNKASKAQQNVRPYKAEQNVNQTKGTTFIGIKYITLYNVSNNTKTRAFFFYGIGKAVSLDVMLPCFLWLIIISSLLIEMQHFCLIYTFG